ncbi:MAG: aldo/keto reductase [Deltaproteobacteria bacterium]|nr:aldo/keto reductase [Deltaproteobacteria bacterium]
MIEGYATAEATEAQAQKHLPLAYHCMELTQLTVSQAGFGCYRVSSGVDHHAKALRMALVEGINLIDTSANYADGGSEALVGQILKDLIESGDLARNEVVVVSKVGYLQGQNYALSRERKRQGRAFPELVEYGEGLEHCIHPEFLRDQLNRSLERLNLETLDFYLLHNPEYYLEWAQKNGQPLEPARAEYYRRIKTAFEYLEDEIVQGRIRYYGISSNTFPATADQPDFTCLEEIWQIAELVATNHHFRLVQLPFNLMEPGAVLEINQPHGGSVLEFAQQKGLGILVNRPLNAFYNNQLFRLAEVPAFKIQPKDEIVRKIQYLSKSEKTLWMKILPALDVPPGLRTRIKEQVAIGDTLKHHWLNFGTYERWRQVKTGNLQPRIQDVMDFLAPYENRNEDISNWTTSHREKIEEAFEAVASIYAEEAAHQVDRIRRTVAAADGEWASEGTLSQKALRAVRSTAAISCVLVGMRREAYVSDVLTELRRPVKQHARLEAWQKLTAELAKI